MVDLLQGASAAEGVDIRCNAAVTAVEKNGSRFTVSTEGGQDFEADLVVHGAGRAPNLEDLALDRANVDHSERGIAVDRTMLTSNPQVYAVGDCAATVQLARAADAEGRVAAADVLRRLRGDGQADDWAMDYDVVPSVLFTYPQYAMVGATEDELKEGDVAHRKSFGKQLSWPTYRRVGLKSAAFKILAGEDGMVLGAHVISDSATGLIHACTLAMMNRTSVADFHRQCILTPYPSRESDITHMLEPLIE
jgi:glutathione reductase (NADPH)